MRTTCQAHIGHLNGLIAIRRPVSPNAAHYTAHRALALALYHARATRDWPARPEGVAARAREAARATACILAR